MTARIALTQGLFALVDDDMVSTLAHYTWAADRRDRCTYARGRKHGVKRQSFYMHRVVLGLGRGDLWAVVDHINHDSLDNRRENLRVVGMQTNAANMRMRRTSRTGVHGVCHDGPRFEATVKVDYVRVFRGKFDTVVEAAVARNAYLDAHGLPHTRSSVEDAMAYDAQQVAA
jgi:hypothetical protein